MKPKHTDKQRLDWIQRHKGWVDATGEPGPICWEAGYKSLEDWRREPTWKGATARAAIDKALDNPKTPDWA